MWGLERSWGRAGEGREGARGETGGATPTDEIDVVYGGRGEPVRSDVCQQKGKERP